MASLCGLACAWSASACGYMAHGQTTGPSIEASVTPPPNRFGWNNTPVSVAFTCSGVPSCPEPIAVTEPGDRQLIRRTVSDADGRTAMVSIEVSIDFAPAALSLIAPSANATVTETAVTVTASVSDTLSGVADATCNGDPATVQGGTIACEIQLRDGVNDLIVQATDRAGNSSSAGVQVHRVGDASSLMLVPSALTLALGQSHAPQVVDEFGRTVADVQWYIANPSVVSLSDDRRTLKAVGPGVSHVTARWGSLAALMNVRVLPTTRLPEWTSEWTIPSLRGYRTTPLLEVINTLRVSPDTPTLISIEHEFAGSRVMLRAIDGDVPRQLWIEAPAISVRELIGSQHAGDEMGAGLLRVQTADGRSNSIVRVGRPWRGSLWRYTPPGRLGEEFAAFDGIVDVVETPPDGFPVLVGIDLSTGSAAFRVPLPRSSHAAFNVGCVAGARARRDRPADVGTPTVLEDGVLNLAVSTTDDVENFLPCGKTSAQRHRIIQLMKVSPDHEPEYRTVYDYARSRDLPLDSVVLGKVLPDGHGGQLVMWSARTSQRLEHRVVRVIGDQLIPFELPARGVTIIAEQDMGVTTDGSTIVGFDVLTGEILWTHQAAPGGSFRLLNAVGGGGFTVATEHGIEHIDRKGERVLMAATAR